MVPSRERTQPLSALRLRGWLRWQTEVNHRMSNPRPHHALSKKRVKDFLDKHLPLLTNDLCIQFDQIGVNTPVFNDFGKPTLV